jgi:hypothetical protein
MQTLFIGGPGRSGTSYVAARIAGHFEVCSLPDIELKLFTEKNGLLDLYHSLVEHYSPNRGSVAVDQFRRMMLALLEGRYGQPALNSQLDPQGWTVVTERFLDRLSESGHPVSQSRPGFLSAARLFVHDLQQLVVSASHVGRTPKLFAEKTPHALLSVRFLEDIAPGSRYLHVMRDPRSIAFSLRQMRWGPDRLETCCAWVKSYCEAWVSVRTRAALDGIKIHETRIEAIAAGREEASLNMCETLGLTSDPKLFSTADATILNRWTRGCDETEMKVIEDTLAAYAHAAGYPAEVGLAHEDAATAL